MVSKLELLLTVEIEPGIGKLLGRYGPLFYTIIALMGGRCSWYRGIRIRSSGYPEALFSISFV